jgi:hypothetical protein
MDSREACEQIIMYYNGKKLEETGDALVVKLADSGARRPKHSTSSSGQSSDQANLYAWPAASQANRYTYPSAAGYNDFSFSPIMPNGNIFLFKRFISFSLPGFYDSNVFAISNQGGVPVNLQYPPNMVYHSPTRQLSSSGGVQPQSPPTPSQMVYQPPPLQMPQQQAVQQQQDYYTKGIYKPQNPYSPPVYYPTNAYVPYVC